MRAFSTFRILPRSGRIAWKRRSRPLFAVPPALFPSTRYSSHCAGSRSLQSASLPGSIVPSSSPLRTTRSRALRAASRARAARMPFSMIRRPSDGCSSRYCISPSATALSTCVFTSALPSRVFVWPSNCGSGSLTLIDGDHALAHVVAAQVRVVVLQELAACARSRSARASARCGSPSGARRRRSC